MSAPVGRSRADDRPRRLGPLIDAVKAQGTSRLTVGRLIPRTLRMFPFTKPTVPAGVQLPETPSGLGVEYDTDWARKPAATLARRAIQATLLRSVVRALADPTVQGLDRLEHVDGPVVFAPNHHSHLDTALLLAAIPARFRERTVVAAGADYFFDKRPKAFLSALTLNAIPLERKKVSRRSSDAALELLRDDWSLIIFPEGGRSPDGWGQEFKPGAAFLAIRRGCPVIPVHLEGTGEVLPKGSGRPRPSKCTVTFGLPIVAEAGEDARRLNVRLERAVAELADEARTDWWQARRNAADGTTPSLTGPTSVGDWRRRWQRSEHERGGRPATPKRRWP